MEKNFTVRAIPAATHTAFKKWCVEQGVGMNETLISFMASKRK